MNNRVLGLVLVGVMIAFQSFTSSVLASETYCTSEYAPVCAQPKMPKCDAGTVCVQVMPGVKTYTNTCAANKDGATVLYSGFCGMSETYRGNCNADAMLCPDGNYVGRTGADCTFDCSNRTCTEDYSPVCGVNNVTYKNACKANLVSVKYLGKCIGKGNEDMIKRYFEAAMSKNPYAYTDHIKAIILEKFIVKCNNLASLQDTFSFKEAVYRFISFNTRQYLQTIIYEPYIRTHLAEIVVEAPTLGGTWYTTELTWISDTIVKINYEDGHVAHAIQVETGILNKKIYIK